VSEGKINHRHRRRALTGAKRDPDSEGWNWKSATVAADAATASPAIFGRPGTARLVACLLLQHLPAPFVESLVAWTSTEMREGRDKRGLLLVAACEGVKRIATVEAGPGASPP